MKKILYILLVALSVFKIHAQSLKKIKSQNVYFILFENDKKLNKYGCGNISPDKEQKDILCVYNFYHENGERFEYSFQFMEYPSPDDQDNDMNKNLVFKMHKSFLKKNKDIIITREFMENVGKNTLTDLFLTRGSNKTIFLINTADIKGEQILLKEVSFETTLEE